MEICEHIVSLGLALRSRRNIRVRQPLQSITITKELSRYYQSIICDELNVKEVKFENPEKLAKKICKPDARKIGPKYGKDVQYIITEAKAGNFIEMGDGTISIPPVQRGMPEGQGNFVPEKNPQSSTSSDNFLTKGSYILESEEYTLEYLPLEGIGDIE